MDPIDGGIDSAILIEAEIESLFRRLAEIDANAMMRIEYLTFRFRKLAEVVEREFH